jgi:predicted ThiF/HesA family dinucleotide-utilizing enzyme
VVEKGRVVDRDGHPVVFIEIAEIIERRLDGMADEYRMALMELLRKAQMEEEVAAIDEPVDDDTGLRLERQYLLALAFDLLGVDIQKGGSMRFLGASRITWRRSGG